MNIRFGQIGWNLLGLLIPLLIAALTIPQLLKALGPERFGFLALAWGLIGYASVLDLGIGRALTQMISKFKGQGNHALIPDAVATAGRITFLAGIMSAMLIAIFTDNLSKIYSAGSDVPVEQLNISILLLAVALPAQAMSATYKGVNEAQLNFKEISFVRMLLGVVNFYAPYLISKYTNNISVLILGLVASRIFALLAFYYLAHKSLANELLISKKGKYSRLLAKDLFKFGFWVTLSGVILPMLIQADRFVIGSVISAAAVSNYVLPFEVVIQSLVIVGSITTVIFPVITRQIHEKPIYEWSAYYRKWLLYVTVVMFIVASFLWLILPTILNIWLSDELQSESISVGRILCLGIFIYSIGSMLYSLQHALGRAEITAKFHIIQVFIYIPLLYYAVKNYGVEGAAAAWVFRVFFDTILLLWASKDYVLKYNKLIHA